MRDYEGFLDLAIDNLFFCDCETWRRGRRITQTNTAGSTGPRPSIQEDGAKISPGRVSHVHMKITAGTASTAGCR